MATKLLMWNKTTCRLLPEGTRYPRKRFADINRHEKRSDFSFVRVTLELIYWLVDKWKVRYITGSGDFLSSVPVTYSSVLYSCSWRESTQFVSARVAAAGRVRRWLAVPRTPVSGKFWTRAVSRIAPVTQSIRRCRNWCCIRHSHSTMCRPTR